LDYVLTAWSISSDPSQITALVPLVTFWIESPILRTVMNSPHLKAPPANSTCKRFLSANFFKDLDYNSDC
jgi:hypothetical protein